MDNVKQLLMVVDDDVTNINVLDIMLRSDYRLVPRKSGEQALEYFIKLGIMPSSGQESVSEIMTGAGLEDSSIKNSLPDLILLDIMMPGINGIDVCTRLKAIPLLQPIPIIFISGQSSPADINKGFAAGAVDYVTKPFNAAELKARVATHLELKKHRDLLEQMVDERTADLKIEMEKSIRLEKNEKLILQDKFSNLEQLAIGLAHEVNQPLTYINTIIQSTIEKFSRNKIDPEKMVVKFNKMAKQTDRIIELTNHLRALRWPGDIRHEQIDMTEVFEDAMVVVSEQIKQTGIDLDCQIPKAPLMLWGNYHKLEQIFTNLTNNSITALQKQDGAEITVEMIPEDEQITIQFSDNGCGMNSDEQDKIYEPFYTTKEHGKGAGIGMGIVLDIVNEHKGEIVCESEEGKGTTFTITLPVGRDDT